MQIARYEQASELATSASIPVVLAGHWNIDATALRDSGRVDHIGGAVLRPVDATCSGRTYAFFVASSCLDFYAQKVIALLDAPVGPRAAATLSLKAWRAKRRSGRGQRRPRPL